MKHAQLKVASVCASVLPLGPAATFLADAALPPLAVVLALEALLAAAWAAFEVGLASALLSVPAAGTQQSLQMKFVPVS